MLFAKIGIKLAYRRKTVKKRFKVLSLLLIACMTFMLAGCNLFPQNNAHYLNQNVITLEYNDGTTINITRQEFLTAYNNYGAELMNSNGQTEAQAKESTINALINREVLLKKAKEDDSISDLLKQKRKELCYETYQALISNARDYESAIREDWEIDEPDTMAEETKEGTVYKKYEKQATVVFDEETQSYRIKKVESNDTVLFDEEIQINTSGTIEEALADVKTAFYKATKENTADTFASEEYRRYLASLRSTQKLMGTNYSDDQLVANEIKRIYDNLEENEYLTQYQEQKQFNDGYSNITVLQVLNKYKAMMSTSKFIYDNNADTYKSDILEKFENVNYVVDDEYFHVAHILIKFSDEQQKRFDELDKLSNNGVGGVVSAGYVAQEKQKLYNSIRGSIRDSETGEITEEDTISVNAILAEIETALKSASTNEQKDNAFRELMYKYNEDDGIMNANYAYVVGENESKMVENFTKASRELNTNGTYGAVSGLVQTEYGVHIVYYMGKCENVFEFAQDGSLTFTESDVLKLEEKKLNNLNNKTLFDLVYESLVQDKYSEYENVDVEFIKSTEIKNSWVSPSIK